MMFGRTGGEDGRMPPGAEGGPLLPDVPSRPALSLPQIGQALPPSPSGQIANELMGRPVGVPVSGEPPSAAHLPGGRSRRPTRKTAQPKTKAQKPQGKTTRRSAAHLLSSLLPDASSVALHNRVATAGRDMGQQAARVLPLAAARQAFRRRAAVSDEILDAAETAATRQTLAPLDPQLLWVTMAILGIGLLALFTASARQSVSETGWMFAYIGKQLLGAVIGFGLMWAVSRMSYFRLRKATYPFAFLSIGLLLLTHFAGSTANGSERWIAIPGVGLQLQPSEFAKVAVVLLLADALGTSRPSFQKLGMALMLSLGMIAMIFAQPNLSVTLIIAGLLFTMCWVGGVNPLLLLTCVGVGIPAVTVKILNTDYQLRRFTGWLQAADPKYAQDEGYNLLQSLKTIANGGLVGVGYGESIHKRGFLPFQHTDFIFSVFCEEFGFLGASCLIGLFAWLFIRGFVVAWQVQSLYGRLVAFGITTTLFLQTWINLAVTTGTIPVTGVTLPLVSYGGTSVMVTLAMVGLLLMVARQPRRAEDEF